MNSRIYYIIWSLHTINKRLPQCIIKYIFNLIIESEIYDIKNTIYNNLYGPKICISNTFHQLVNLYDINGHLDNILRYSTLSSIYFNNLLVQYINKYKNKYHFIITNDEYKILITDTYKYLFTTFYNEIIIDAYNLYSINNNHI